MEAEVVNQVTQGRRQYPIAFHVAEKVEAKNCGAAFCRCVVDDVSLRSNGTESRDGAKGGQQNIDTESVGNYIEQVNHNDGHGTRGYDYRHSAEAIGEIAGKWPCPECHGKYDGYRSRRCFFAGAKSIDQEKRDKGNDGHYQCHGERAQYNHGYHAAHITGSSWGFRFDADVLGRCFAGRHVFPKYGVEYYADADAEDGHGDKWAAPVPGSSNAGGNQRCQEVAETAADKVKAERLAAFCWCYHGRYHGGGGRVIAAPHYTHQHQAGEQYKIVGRQADQKPGSTHADDTHGEQGAGPNAVGEPTCR